MILYTYWTRSHQNSYNVLLPCAYWSMKAFNNSMSAWDHIDPTGVSNNPSSVEVKEEVLESKIFLNLNL